MKGTYRIYYIERREQVGVPEKEREREKERKIAK